MNEIKIKPLSINGAWRGRRFKTDEYLIYINTMCYLLPKKLEIYPKMKIDFIFGFSSSGSDIDNPVKPILDILQKFYRFNDSQIYEMSIKKEIVNKGNEFIKFKIIELCH